MFSQDFVAKRDVDIVRRATKGIGTNESSLVYTLCNRTKKQLDAVDLIYHKQVTAGGLSPDRSVGWGCEARAWVTPLRVDA